MQDLRLALRSLRATPVVTAVAVLSLRDVRSDPAARPGLRRCARLRATRTRIVYLTDKVIGLISTAGGTQGLQGVNTMEFVVRALRGWAVPLVIPIPQAWRAFEEGHVLNESLSAQLRALGGEVARAAGHFASGRITTSEASRAEATLQPVSDAELRRAR